VARLQRALHETRIAGVQTCRDFLLRIAHTDEFRAGTVSTPFVPRLLKGGVAGGVR
jgi:pyruvate carboxylase